VGSAIQRAFPTRMRQTLKLPFGEMVQAFDGSNGWTSAMGKVQDQPSMADEAQKDWAHSLFRLFSKPGDLKVQALPDAKTVDGATYRVALVHSDLVRDWQLWFDQDGRLARMEYMDKGPNGDATFTTVYSDWRKVGDVQYPYAMKTTVEGEPFMEATVTSAEANPALKDDLFAKPAE
jgi:hypothetical protein